MLRDHVRTLEDLAAFLERATTAFEVFGNDLEGKFLLYVGICHPDRYLAVTEQAKAAKVFQQLVRWRAVARQTTGPQTIGSPSRTYEIITRQATGDLADVELAVADGVRYVLKITRPVGGNGLITSEARHLKALVARCGDRRYREYLPKWVETLLLPGENRQGNVFVYREGFHTLEQVLRQHPNGLDARQLAWIFKRMLAGPRAVALCRRDGWRALGRFGNKLSGSSRWHRSPNVRALPKPVERRD